MNYIHSIERFVNRYARYSPLVLRLGLAFVFVWFGWSGIFNTELWTGLVPAWTGDIAPAATLVKIHGLVELTFGLLLAFGVYTRLSAFILCVSLVHTTFLLSGPTMVRDIGLSIALLSVVFSAENVYTEKRYENKNT